MQRARFLNKESVIERLREIATALRAKDSNILRIVLFGSLADDTYTASSDADILIIIEKSSQRLLDRIADYLAPFGEAPVPVDIFPYTKEESSRLEFAQKAMEKGIILA